MDLRNIEAIYSITPLQEAMLLQSPGGLASENSCGQFTCALEGDFDLFAFEAAWKRALSHHCILRSSFAWKRIERPLQIIHKEMDISLALHDLRGLTSDQQQSRLSDFLKEDRQKGFDPAVAPLMRLALFHLSEDSRHLAWSYHRLLIDQRSSQMIFNGVLELYRAYSEGRDRQPRASRPFHEYVEWLKRQDNTEADEFWRSSLGGFCSPIMASAFLTSTEASGRQEPFVLCEAELSGDKTANLESLAQRFHLSIDTIVAGVWALLLSRYSGIFDVTFGAAISGRPRELEGADAMIGPLGNMLPMRAQVAEERGAIDWLMEFHQKQLQLQRFAHASLSQIHSFSDVAAHHLMFDSSVVIDKLTVDENAVASNGKPHISGIQNFGPQITPISLEAIAGKNLKLRITCEGGSFEKNSARRTLGHLQNMIEGIIADPNTAIMNLPLLTQAEQHQIVVQWNNTSERFPPAASIQELFETQAARASEHIAVIFGDEQLSFEELNRRANRLAHYLMSLGVGPEIIVGICMQRSIDMIVSMLGALKAGGAFLPMDPAYPLERLAFMMEDARIAVLLTHENLVDSLPTGWTQEVCLDSDWDAIAGCSDENPARITLPDHLAYVIFTSGSTGKPKGVMLHHRGLRNLARAVVEPFFIREASRLLQFSSLSFDASIPEIFAPLVTGATICLGMQESLIPGPGLIELLKGKRITNVIFPPSILAALPQEELPDLESMVVAGEACPASLVEVWGKGRHFVDAYGPTEATVCATSGECLNDNTKPSIGKPIANTQVYLLDARQRLVPIGVPGELHIGGMGLARGYLNRPDLTAERFIANPFSDQPGERLYKTGDLARYLPDGSIDFAGRLDHQVKIRGFRVELGEIEASLIAHSGVRDAVVIAKEVAAGDKRVIAYVVAKDDQDLNSAKLRGFLKDRLPDYMIPSAFIMLDRMPLTQSGKVDLKALPDLERANEDFSSAYVAPRNSVEETLASIWADALNINRVGVHDNFFELGGHSLLIGQIVARVAEEFNIELKLRALFDTPTVAGMAASIEQSQIQQQAAPTIQARPRGKQTLNHLLTRLDQLSDREAEQMVQTKALTCAQEDQE